MIYEVAEDYDSGKFYAFAMVSPYFCFEGNSKEEVSAIAERALKVYREQILLRPGRFDSDLSKF